MNWDWDKLKDNQQHGGLPPQFDDLMEKIKNFKLPGGSILIAVIIAGFFALTCFFTVGVDEVGVIQRFGQYVRTTQPGLNFKLPAGIETVKKVKVRRVYKMEFESLGGAPDGRSGLLGGSDIEDKTLMLTGDLNVALVPWIVQYRIKDPYNFLFKVNDVEGLLSDMSEASMRLVVGDRSINEVITKRDEIAVEAKALLETELDNAEAGISIVTIEMKKTNVPTPVQASFNEVNQAVQDKETMIYQAKEDYNKAIPEARGEADRTVKTAEGYALERINQAKGDATRFLAQYGEYAKAKDITKRRMYLEVIGEVFPKLGQKYIVDSEQKNMLPLLNLGKESGAQK
ncbi:MAG: FtsH protease activity modulator HflK [Pseudomonadota bacterium]